MAVDSRAKGARAESDLVKKLKTVTGHDFKRVPLSGGLHASHGLKGDLYIPNSLNIYCIEVKHYKDDHLTSKVLTDKESQLEQWWKQTIREAAQISRKPLLIYKFDRSKWFAAWKDDFPNANHYKYMVININGMEFFTSKLDDWLTYENPRFV
jgi:Holliday junction resolvase